MSLRSTTRWYFEPGLPRPFGLGPVCSSPFWPTRSVNPHSPSPLMPPPDGPRHSLPFATPARRAKCSCVRRALSRTWRNRANRIEHVSLAANVEMRLKCFRDEISGRSELGADHRRPQGLAPTLASLRPRASHHPRSAGSPTLTRMRVHAIRHFVNFHPRRDRSPSSQSSSGTKPHQDRG
jgi:hypothetical protein